MHFLFILSAVGFLKKRNIADNHKIAGHLIGYLSQLITGLTSVLYSLEPINFPDGQYSCVSQTQALFLQHSVA